MRKIRKYLSSIVVVVISISALIGATFLSKKIKKPTYISNANELNEIRNDLSGYYVVKNPISISDLKKNDEFDGWIPIGTKEKPFTGRIDFNYNQLTDLYFSQAFIDNQIYDSTIDEVLIGFIGYSEGTIIHADFYKPIMPNLLNTENKKIVLGTICAVNNGFVTSSKVSFVSEGGIFEAQNVIYGTLVGINKKQILIGKSINTTLLKAKGEIICGGIVGLAEIDSINSYLFRAGYMQINLMGESNVSVGGIIGKMDGGTINNCYVGPVVLDSDPTSLKINNVIDNESSIRLGGIVGLTSSSAKIIGENLYVSNSLIDEIDCDDNFVSGIIGLNNSNDLEIKNSFVQSNFTITSNNLRTDCLINGFSEKSKIINNFVSEEIFSHKKLMNQFDCDVISFDNLSCKMLNWNTSTKTCHWEKGKKCFYLNLL